MSPGHLADTWQETEKSTGDDSPRFDAFILC